MCILSDEKSSRLSPLEVMRKKLIKMVVIPSLVTTFVILSLIIAEEDHGSRFFRLFNDIFLVLVLPILPIIYGRITENKIGSILIGAMPFLGYFVATILETFFTPISMRWLICTSIYWIALFILLSLEGYFASKRSKFSLLIAIGLYISFMFIFIFWGLID